MCAVPHSTHATELPVLHMLSKPFRSEAGYRNSSQPSHAKCLDILHSIFVMVGSRFPCMLETEKKSCEVTSIEST